MKNCTLLLFFSLIFLSCSSTEYKAPLIVYKAGISPRLDPSKKVFSINDYSEISNLSKSLNTKAKLIVFYQNYDVYNYVSTPYMAESIVFGIDTFIQTLANSKQFKSINKFSISHIKVNSISDMIEICRRTAADAFILVSSTYNYYKYSNTLGYFLAWMPIINFFTPIHATYAQVSLQLELFNKYGKGIYTDAVNYEQKENLSVAFSKDHFKRIGKELNYKAYSNLANLLIDKIKKRD